MTREDFIGELILRLQKDADLAKKTSMAAIELAADVFEYSQKCVQHNGA